MSPTKKRNLYLSLLNENFVLLEKSMAALAYSSEKCNAIGEKEEYNLEEQESFEALTSRFARTSDILTQKVFKTLFILLQENIKTIIDAANLLEKLEVVDDADNLLNIREIRNQIAHEYVDYDIKPLFFDVLRYIPELEKIIKNTKAYSDKNLSTDKNPGK